MSDGREYFQGLQFGPWCYDQPEGIFTAEPDPDAPGDL